MIPDDEFLGDYYRDAYTLQSDIKTIEPKSMKWTPRAKPWQSVSMRQ